MPVDNVLDTPPVVFTTPAELLLKMGAGYEHITNGAEAACTQATDFVWFYVQKIAPVERLARSRVVRNWAKIVACYFVTADTGETHVASFKEEFDLVLQQLELVQSGRSQVPDIEVVGSEQKGAIPVLSILAVDVGMNPSVRVNRVASTGQPEGYAVATHLPTQRRRFF